VAQFDVYPNPIEELRDEQPYVIQLQSNFVQSPIARIAIPLARMQSGTLPMSRVNPRIEVAGESLVLDTLFITSFDPAELRHPVANLRADAEFIYSAVDYVLHGY
jgi:toxin CcdB